MVLIQKSWCLLSLVALANSLGMSVEPVKAGDSKKYSSKNYLFNCVSYPTVADDVVMVRIQSGDRIKSHSLNLHVFDDDDNTLRFQKDISGEVNFMFNNLNNPVPISQAHKRSGLLQMPHFKQSESEKKKGHELLNSNNGKSLVYVCFDNLYSDKSWSFTPSTRDIELEVTFKTLQTLKETNYNNYAHYFSRLNYQESQASQSKSLTHASSTAQPSHAPQPSQVPRPDDEHKDFTEKDFETNVEHVKHELNAVVESLHNSELILNTLLEQESKLRDTNEAIFTGYTHISIVFLVSILVCGLIQMAIVIIYLKKKRIL